LPKYNVTPITINLKKVFGRDFPDSKALKQAVGQALVDKLIKRTEKGRDKNMQPFKKYSPNYKGSLEFKAHGKTERVNLTLTGDMLRSVDVVDNKQKNILRLDFDDPVEEVKAHGHIKGAGKLPKRDFWGLSEKEIDEVAKDFRDDVDRFTEGDKTGGGVLDLAQTELLRRFLRGRQGT